ncbi:MAG: GAF and ANTAR domain-containing protein [Acidimicrobiales bacterium]|jgi:GAF domain-containing protein
MTRESLLVATLVELADNLVDNFDVIDVLTLLSDRCVEAVDVDAAGVMLKSPAGELEYVASSSDTMRVLELFQIQADEGPCVDCLRDGMAIVNRELVEPDERWPRFTPKARELGFQSVHCLPLRLRGQTIGALNLFRIELGFLDDEDVVVAQALADVATIAILQHQSSLAATTLNEQLNRALTSRIIIEQAKGMISESMSCNMDDAFAMLRAHSRNHNLGLTSVANSVVEGTLFARDLDAPKKAPRH